MKICLSFLKDKDMNDHNSFFSGVDIYFTNNKAMIKFTEMDIKEMIVDIGYEMEIYPDSIHLRLKLDLPSINSTYDIDLGIQL